MYENRLSQSQAREAFRYLKRGVCPHSNIDLFTVGLENEIRLIRSTLESIRNGALIGKTCFLEAPYGYGKSHLLKVIESAGLEQRFAVTHVTHDGYDRAFNHPPRYIHRLFENLSVPGLSTRGLGNVIPQLLRGSQRNSLLNWTNTPAVRWGIGYHIRQIADTSDSADHSHWRYLINCHDMKHRGTYYYPLLYEKLKTLAELCRAIGLSGLVVLFDEVESIATLLPNVRSRLRSYEILGELSNSLAFPGCCFFFAVTPDFGHRIQNWDYPHEYGYYMKYHKDLYATGCRFMEAWVNHGSNILQIAKISAAANKYLCRELARLHEYAYCWSSTGRISSAVIERYVAEAQRCSLSQREIVRCFVNTLDVCQQHRSYDPGVELFLSSESNGADPSPILTPVCDGDHVIGRALLSLTHRQQRVVRLRFGLEDGTVHTLEQIARELNVTRERVRQIQDEALEELRKPAVSERMAGILNAKQSLGKQYQALLGAVFKEPRP